MGELIDEIPIHSFLRWLKQSRIEAPRPAISRFPLKWQLANPRGGRIISFVDGAVQARAQVRHLLGDAHGTFTDLKYFSTAPELSSSGRIPLSVAVNSATVLLIFCAGADIDNISLVVQS